MSVEMPKREWEPASLRGETKEDMAYNKRASDGTVKNNRCTEGKKKGAVDGALENPSVFTSTVVDEELTYREAL